ncbi:MAG TPA: hypothetical protein VIE36_02660 [Methylomirabilota bacterium]
MNTALNTLNFLLATAQWLIVGRLVMRAFVRNESNAVWQVFLISTDPVYRLTRTLTMGRVPERWVWLVSLIWLFLARILVVVVQRELHR